MAMLVQTAFLQQLPVPEVGMAEVTIQMLELLVEMVAQAVVQVLVILHLLVDLLRHQVKVTRAQPLFITVREQRAVVVEQVQRVAQIAAEPVVQAATV
jgi:hypothetical protein